MLPTDRVKEQKRPAPPIGGEDQDDMRDRATTETAIEKRFWEKVERNSSQSCWQWRGARTKLGYGQFRLRKQPASGVRYATVYAHRFAYELLRGAIPSGLELDHLCRSPSCINPEHLEAVTHRENIKRGRNKKREKTCCPKGHLYDAANTYRFPSNGGGRTCKICHSRPFRKNKA